VIFYVLSNEVKTHLCLYLFVFQHFIFAGVKAGGDRQELHEEIRVHSMAAGAVVKGEGKPNDLLDRIQADAKFAAVHDKLHEMLDPSKFVGRAPQQVDEFLGEEIDPMLEKFNELLAVESVDGVNV
jgi:adenylosuccinate lyase